ncbi:MAG: hypothetical protein JSW08_03475 [archaeon]|nr:MAG: hypothetical protein JSW08_03475 [archaeon]
MKRIVLLSCVSTKLKYRAKTKDLYISPYFKFSLRYARKLSPDKIFILSAKHGLLNLDDEIEPYNLTLNKMLLKKRKEWANKVLNQLRKVVDFQKDEVIFLTGKRYRELLTPFIRNYKEPLKGLGFGKILKFLKENSK